MKKEKLKVLFISAEVTPIAKAGGLGDVAGALPKALLNLNVDIRLCLPFYGLIDRKKYKAKKILSNLALDYEGKKEKINIWETKLDGTMIPVYLIEHKFFNDKKIYLGSRIEMGKKYSRGLTDLNRFAFFSKAALEFSKKFNFQPQIIHANDWHTGLIKDYANEHAENFFKKTKVIYTIHNLANQGVAYTKENNYFNLDTLEKVVNEDMKNKDINFMVQGILTADAVNTVSPTYAKEIFNPQNGAGLENVIKKRKNKIVGILNGLDTVFFNPQKDKLISKNYNFKSLDKKQENKLLLQKKLGWPETADMPLIGLVSRFVRQKGIDLITEKFSELNCQFVILGSGSPEIEKYLLAIAKKYPNKFSVQIKFDEQLAHEIYASADIFLMPSRFEPCGLGQMIAMRYGAVPVARATGGLADTIKNYELKITNSKIIKANGFLFKKEDSRELYNTLASALDIYRNQPKIWRTIQINGMKENFSWDKSAREYLRLYKKILK